MVSGGRDRSVALWDVRTHRQLGHSPEHRGSLCAVAVSHDGKRLASGCSANTIKFWNPADMRKSLKSISYHESVIRSLCFSPDGRTLASGSEDDTVKLWNVTTYQEVASFNFRGHVRLVLFSPDGNNLAVVTDRGSLQLVRATPKEQADAEIAASLK
jgi:WD40 repeat protein